MTIASKSTVLHRMACSLSLPLPFLPLSSPASPSLSLPPPLFLPLSPFPLYLVSCPIASCQLRERRTAKDCMYCMWWKYIILVALPSLALHISEDVNHSVIIHREPGRERGRRRERERGGYIKVHVFQYKFTSKRCRTGLLPVGGAIRKRARSELGTAASNEATS